MRKVSTLIGKGEIMHTFTKRPLHIEDIVVYLKNERTGSSTIRKCKFVGQVVGFTQSKVKIMRLSKPDRWVVPNTARDYGEDEIYPEDVICIIISKSEDDVNAKNTDCQN